MTDADPNAPRSWLSSVSTLQQRFEESRAGRIVISAIIVLIVATGVTTNLPDAPITRTAQSVTNPIAKNTSLDVGWAMFAPDPAKRLEKVDVEVTMADGSIVLWSLQPGDKFVGAFAWTHWEKLMSTVFKRPELRPAIARWIVGQVTPSGQRAVHVDMIFRTEALGAPGVQTSKSPASKVLYQEDLAGNQ